MTQFLNRLFQNKVTLIILILVASSNITIGQNIMGPDPAEVNSTHYYSYNAGTSVLFPTWTVTGGAVVSSSVEGGTFYSVEVQWGSTPGTGSVTFKSKRLIISSLSVTITAAGPTPPAVPDMPTITNYPGYTRLTMSIPPTGETWYWQDTPTGTSTLNSNQSVDRTTGTVYYLRSYASSTSLWSSALTINYTIDPVASGLSNENYIHTIVPQIGTTDVSGLDNDQKIENVTYFDGLGRPMQSIGIRAGGNGEDIITHIGYDDFGRQDKEYLPYSETSNGGLYRTESETATLNYYDVSEYDSDFPGMTVANINPYSEKHLESSPLNRVLEQGAPGAAWKVDKSSDIDHTIKFNYQTNTATEVRLYEVTLSFDNNTYTPTLTGGTYYYGAGELYKTITKDENWTSGNNHTTKEFKDKLGRVVLKRSYNNGVAHDTYYVYDDYGNLTYVIPPKATDVILDANNAIVQSVLDNLCYQYKYDHRNRLVEKKIPGKGDANTWEEIVYNKLDQPIMTRDPNLKAQGKWLVTKYDAFGRVAYTAMKNSGSGRVYFQSTFDADTSPNITQYEKKVTSGSGCLNSYYTYTARPTAVDEILTINYYDDYTFDMDGLSLPSIADGQTVVNYNNASSTKMLTKGLATGSKVKVLDTNDWITTITGYDDKGRPIYITSKNNYLSTADIVVNKLDFVGNVDKTTATHAMGGQNTITTVDVFEYGDTGRLLSQKQQINTQPQETIVENHYDELGQLQQKSIGGKTTQSRLQTVDYTYNIRGWLKGINNTGGSNSAITLGTDDLFGFQINYNDPTDPTKALFNGNISQTLWTSTSINPNPPNNPISNKYTYAYDALNRITEAIDNTGNYNIPSIAYDKNGNITSLERRGHTNESATDFGTMDDLSYTYQTNSNKLFKVADAAPIDQFGFKDDAVNTATDTADDYSYDSNGNMKTDTNKEITNIEYNHLNLPKVITFANNDNKISYIYDATGIKQMKIVEERVRQITMPPDTGILTTKTQYANNFVYEHVNDGGQLILFVNNLKFINHPEGYVEREGKSGFRYIYQYKDHLGNIRLSYKDVDENYLSLVNDTFDSGMDGWIGNNIVTENGRLKVTVKNQYSGALKHILQPFNAGEKVYVKLDMDKYTTTVPIRVLINERDANDNSLGWYSFGNAENGTFEGVRSIVNNNVVRIVIKLDITPGISFATQFYIDNIVVNRGELEIVEENNYYPFGGSHKGYNNVVNGVHHPYGFNGKEENDELGLNMLDFGARMYDKWLGRWHVTDGKAELYFANSPYNFALNTPINAVDPDGNLVIFINGLGGGGASYWRTYEKVRAGVTLNRMGNETPIYRYDLRHAFDLDVSRHLGDNNRMYIDGSPGSIFNNFTSGQRFSQGYKEGSKLAASLIGSLARDPQGNITETIKIITHSMGGVYGKGFVSALKYYIKTSKDPQVRKALITLVADFDPFQAGGKLGKADKNTHTQQFINSGWWNIFGAGWLANQEEEDADEVTDNPNKTSHFIETFFDNIDDLQEGTYEWDKDKQEWICTSCKND